MIRKLIVTSYIHASALDDGNSLLQKQSKKMLSGDLRDGVAVDEEDMSKCVGFRVIEANSWVPDMHCITLEQLAAALGNFNLGPLITGALLHTANESINHADPPCLDGVTMNGIVHTFNTGIVADGNWNSARFDEIFGVAGSVGLSKMSVTQLWADHKARNAPVGINPTTPWIPWAGFIEAYGVGDPTDPNAEKLVDRDVLAAIAQHGTLPSSTPQYTEIPSMAAPGETGLYGTPFKTFGTPAMMAAMSSTGAFEQLYRAEALDILAYQATTTTTTTTTEAAGKKEGKKGKKSDDDDDDDDDDEEDDD